MFKQLFSALRSGDALDRAFDEFTAMLDHARWMFVQANDVLRRRVSAEEVRDPIYERDQQINELLRGIRRKIVRHLSIGDGSDVGASLALMSVAKDAERIGDYCKNVFEVGRFYSEDFHLARYHDPLESIREQATLLFDTVRQAWVDSDHRVARAAITTADNIRDRCNDIIEQLLHDRETITTHEAVAYSLLARHYKRVAAHLANISTAVTGRIEDMDFRS